MACAWPRPTEPQACSTFPAASADVPMPEPWEFDIEFDETNGHLTRVVKGDNEKYQAYIEAHNRSMDSAASTSKKLIPVAEETKVVIALENVWNNFCVKPSIFKWMVASFQSPWVKAYFDVGNHVKYLTPPEVWIREFGPLLAQVHIKDFKLNPDNHGGRFVHPRDGSVNWPAVRQALEDVGYNGWLTIEDGGIPLCGIQQASRPDHRREVGSGPRGQGIPCQVRRIVRRRFRCLSCAI